MKKLLPVLLFLIVISACTQKINDPDNLPIARVYDKYLLTSDLQETLPKNLTEMDSLALVKDYIEKWVQKELLLYKAEENLTESEKNVEKQINEYRTSLLVFKYEQNLIQQKLDTTISDADIETYYKNNPSNFILNETLIKGLYIKVPRSAPDIWKLRKWYKSDKDEDFTELERYCYQNAKEVDYFDDKWVPLENVIEKMPKLYYTQENLAKSIKHLEVNDSEYYYFLRIFDYQLEGTISPLELVNTRIKDILLNKRKIQLINTLEADIYNDALNRGNFNIY